MPDRYGYARLSCLPGEATSGSYQEKGNHSESAQKKRNRKGNSLLMAGLHYGRKAHSKEYYGEGHFEAGPTGIGHRRGCNRLKKGDWS